MINIENFDVNDIDIKFDNEYSLIDLQEDEEPVNKINKEPTTLLLKTNEYIFDVNTLLLPFPLEYRGSIVDTIVVEQKDSTITVNGSSTLGVPTLYDKTLLIALQKIFIQQRSINNQIFFKKENVTKEDRTLAPVSLNEIARALGYTSTPSVDVKLRICNSIRRLTTSTYTTTNDRIYDYENEKFLMTAEKAIHLIDYELITISNINKSTKQGKKSNSKEKSLAYKEKKGQIFDGLVKITLSDIVYNAIACNQLVYYNDKEALEIKNLTARHIYLLAKKWSGKKQITISYDTLLTYFPMKENKLEKHKKEAIKKAVEIIKQSGKCKVSFFNNDNIHFSWIDKKEKIEPDYLKNKFNTFGEMIEGFKSFGLTQEEIFNLNMEKQKYYEALLRYLTIRRKYKEFDNPRAIIMSYIENEYQIDKKYYN